MKRGDDLTSETIKRRQSIKISKGENIQTRTPCRNFNYTIVINWWFGLVVWDSRGTPK